MTAPPQQSDWTVQQYLDYERDADSRHEFIARQVYAMAGAPERHNQLTSALNFLLYGQLLERPYQVFQSDIRVQASADAFFYPDVVAGCEQAQYHDDRRDTLLNPTVIIEVLSPSTEDFDRGRKFTHYRGITTLQDYILVSQQTIQIDDYVRQAADKWILTVYRNPEDMLKLPAIDCTLLLGDVYCKVTFDDGD